MSEKKVFAIGTGHAVPYPVSNDDMMKYFPNLGVTKEWIEQKIRIERRHTCMSCIPEGRAPDPAQIVPAEGWRNSDLCVMAIGKALDNAGISANEVDMVIVSTCTPDTPVPPESAIVMEKLGLNGIVTMDVRSACCGSTLAIETADAYLRTGRVRTVAVVGCDTGTLYGNMDKTVSPTFTRGDAVNACMIGDAAGALILRAFDADEAKAARGPELIYVEAKCIGNGKEPGMWLESGGSARPFCQAVLNDGGHFFKHDFATVLQHGAELYWSAIQAGLRALNLTLEEFDYFIPHQANAQITQFAEKMGVEAARVHEHFRMYGNTANASLPLGLDLVAKENRLPDGALVMMLAAESTKWLYGCTVFRWHPLVDGSASAVSTSGPRSLTVGRWARWRSALRAMMISVFVRLLGFCTSIFGAPRKRH